MPTADELLGAAVAAGLVECLERAAPEQRFAATRSAGAGFADLALSARAMALRDAILADLSGDFAALEGLVRGALEEPSFAGWMTWPVGEAVATSAVATVLAGEDSAFDRGLDLLRALTPRLTSEFAIRTLLRHDLDRALASMRPWTADPDPAVRRLVSEGTRPRLPWATRVPEITARPEAALPLVDALRGDEDEVVRRSVANHVNDVARVRPELAVQTCARWLADPDDHSSRLVRHALRTLVKDADPAALALLGVGDADGLEVTGPVIAGSGGDAEQVVVPPEGEIAFTVSVRNARTEPAAVAIDYVMHFLKANGTTAPKVFKLATRTLAPGEVVQLERRRSFRPLTTRRYHPGLHAMEVQVNGRRFGRVEFLLAG